MSDPQHPPWCDPSRCRAYAEPAGAHASAPTTIPFDDRSFETAVVWLVQRPPTPAWPDPVPIVQVEVYDGVWRHTAVLREG